MDFPSSLDDQQIEKKKKLSPRWGFLLLIAVLLGLNFYFLIFNGKNSEEMTKTLPQGKESNLGEWQIEALDQGKNITLGKIVSPPSKIQQVSFSKSEDKKFGYKIVQSLKFEVRKNLHYTICKIVSRKKINCPIYPDSCSIPF